MMMMNNCDLKHRNNNVRSLLEKCIAIGLKRCTNHSPVVSNFSSSLSMSSDQADYKNRFLPSMNGNGKNSVHGQCHSPLLDKVSLTSTTLSSSITNEHIRECVCQRSPANGVELFNEMIKENSASLTANNNSFNKISLLGLIYPTTLIVTGGQNELETLCSLWSKRILKAPSGYSINFVGYTNNFQVVTISQSHFTPLTEALYRCIDELNTNRIMASLDNIIQQLYTEFPSMELPSEDILKNTLQTMIIENKIIFDGNKQVYNIVNGFAMPFLDEFENLSITDHSNNGSRNDDLPFEFKQFNSEQSDNRNNNNNNNNNGHNLSGNGYSNFAELIFPGKKCKSHSNKSSLVTSTEEDDYSENIININHNNVNNNNNDITTNDNGSSSSKVNNKNKKIIRRNSSSLSNEEMDADLARCSKTSFRRSKSFKLNHKSASNETDDGNNVDDRKCNCSDLIKRQSLLGKLFKLNTHLKGRAGMITSSTISSPNSLITGVDFGSQFPEEQLSNNKTLVIYNGNLNQMESNRFSHKGTQTVKSGPEEIITVVMRQVGKHALSRKRTKEKNVANVDDCCCHNRLSRNNKYSCFNESTMIQRQRSDSGKKFRHHRNHSNLHNNECQRCYAEQQTNGNIVLDSTMPILVGKHTDNRLRKHHRNASTLKHHQAQQHHHNNHNHHHYHCNRMNNRINLIEQIDSSNGHCCAQINNGFIANAETKPMNQRKDQVNRNTSHTIDHYNDLNQNNNNNNNNNGVHNLDDKCLELFNLNETMPFSIKNEIIYPNKINDCTDDEYEDETHNNNDDDNQHHFGRRKSRQDMNTNSNKMINNNNNSNNQHQISLNDNVQNDQQQRQSHANVLINNSLSVKIEIETSNRPPTSMVPRNQNHSFVQENVFDTMAKVNNVSHLLKSAQSDHYPNEHFNGQLKQHQHQQPPPPYFNGLNNLLTNGATVFANGTYHQLNFEDNDKIQPNNQRQTGFNNGANNVLEYKNKFIHPPELNYVNSITALKEQIARAKANFFKESFTS